MREGETTFKKKLFEPISGKVHEGDEINKQKQKVHSLIAGSMLFISRNIFFRKLATMQCARWTEKNMLFW